VKTSKHEARDGNARNVKSNERNETSGARPSRPVGGLTADFCDFRLHLSDCFRVVRFRKYPLLRCDQARIEAETTSLLSSRLEKFFIVPLLLFPNTSRSYSTARCLVYQTLVVYWAARLPFTSFFLRATVSRIGSASAARPTGCERRL